MSDNLSGYSDREEGMLDRVEELQQKADKWMKISETLYQAINQYAGSTKLTQEAIHNYEKARDGDKR